MYRTLTELKHCFGREDFEGIGRWQLVLAVNLFTVPSIPSHGDFPWLVAKKFHIQSIEKSVR